MQYLEHNYSKKLFIVYLKFKFFGHPMFYLAAPFIHKYNQENSLSIT